MPSVETEWILKIKKFRFESRILQLSKIKNNFAIFSGAVAIGSKGGLMVQVAVWDVRVAMWAIVSDVC